MGIVTIEGSVESPVADVLSKLIVTAHTSSDGLTSSTMSSPVGADASFRIDGIRPGKISLNYFLPRGAPAGVNLLLIERNGVAVREGIDVRAGENITGLRLALVSAAALYEGR